MTSVALNPNQENIKAVRAPTINTIDADVLVIGAGPAGIVAATQLAEAGREVWVIEQMALPGGQIWRNALWRNDVKRASAWITRFNAAPIQRLFRTRVVHVQKNGVIVAESLQVNANGEKCSYCINAKHLVLATGARELFLPFPGWTLPKVTGAGALQVMVKDGLAIQDQQVVVAGTGPILLAVAETLHKRGAKVLAIIEQRTRWQLFKFALGLWRWPKLIGQAVSLLWRLRHIPYLTNAWVESAEADVKDNHILRLVNIRHGAASRTNAAVTRVNVDWLACGYGLRSNHELASLTQQQSDETKSERVYVIGDGDFVAGVDAAIASAKQCVEEILAQAKRNEPFHRSAPSYGVHLQKHFGLRPEVLQLAKSDTVICRCENVRFSEVQAFTSVREAKLYTRLGMGQCQGKICMNSCYSVFGWKPLKARSPIFPAAMQSLAAKSIAVHASEHMCSDVESP